MGILAFNTFLLVLVCPGIIIPMLTDINSTMIFRLFNFRSPTISFISLNSFGAIYIWFNIFQTDQMIWRYSFIALFSLKLIFNFIISQKIYNCIWSGERFSFRIFLGLIRLTNQLDYWPRLLDADYHRTNAAKSSGVNGSITGTGKAIDLNRRKV